MLVVLILFGHNAMLTAEAGPDRGADVVTVTFVTSVDHGEHTRGNRELAPAHTQHPSHMDVDCGISASVATLQSSGFPAQLTPAGLIDAVTLPSIGSSGDSSPEPTTPPSVRRALLQVYRI